MLGFQKKQQLVSPGLPGLQVATRLTKVSTPREIPSGIPKPSPIGKIASVVKCSRVNCATCPVFHPSKYFKSSLTNGKYQVVGNCNLSCSTSNLVYLITCSKCDNQYVGETKQKLSKRLSGHRSAIKKHANKFIAKHFNQPGHSVADILIQPIEKMELLPGESN